MVQLFASLTLDFGSSHDPSRVGLSPTWGSVLSVEPAGFCLFLCPSVSRALLSEQFAIRLISFSGKVGGVAVYHALITKNAFSKSN